MAAICSPKAALSLLVMAAGVCALTACSPPTIGRDKARRLNEELKTRGLIVGFEGLQPFSGRRVQYLVEDAAAQAGLSCAVTSGNPRGHLPFVELAHRHGQPIYVVGYSMGGDDAMRLAELCRARRIPVRGLFLVDPRYLADPIHPKVPPNVHASFFYVGATLRPLMLAAPGPRLLADPESTSLQWRYFSTVDHMELPFYVAPIIVSEIARDAGRWRPTSQPDRTAQLAPEPPLAAAPPGRTR